mgnify:CR=1 FL=1
MVCFVIIDWIFILKITEKIILEILVILVYEVVLENYSLVCKWWAFNVYVFKKRAVWFFNLLLKFCVNSSFSNKNNIHWTHVFLQYEKAIGNKFCNLRKQHLKNGVFFLGGGYWCTCSFMLEQISYCGTVNIIHPSQNHVVSFLYLFQGHK